MFFYVIVFVTLILMTNNVIAGSEKNLDQNNFIQIDQSDLNKNENKLHRITTFLHNSTFSTTKVIPYLTFFASCSAVAATFGQAIEFLPCNSNLPLASSIFTLSTVIGWKVQDFISHAQLKKFLED